MSAAGKTVGSLAALLLGRRLLRPFIARYLADRGGGGALHRHLLRELREHPIQTMSLLRAAPLPTPLKIYGLSLFPAELIPLTSYAGIAVTFNLLWSLVWTLASSSAHSLADAKNSSTAVTAGKISLLLVLLGLGTQFSRFAHAQLQVPPEELMQGALVPAAALPPAASPAPPAVGAAALNLILSPSLMSSSQPRRRPPSPRRRAAPPRRRATSPRADASPRAAAPPTRADAPTRSPARRAARPVPRRR